MNLLVQLVAAVAIGILQWLTARRDLIQEGQRRELEEAWRRAGEAMAWKESHPLPDEPDLGDVLKKKHGQDGDH